MNSSDDSTDKALKERFQRVFNDFERTPSRSLKKRIWHQLSTASTTRSRYIILAVILLLFLIGGALYGPKRILSHPAAHVQPEQLVPGQNSVSLPQAQKQSAPRPDQLASDAGGLVTDEPTGSSTQPTVRQAMQPDKLPEDAKALGNRQSVRPAARITRSRTASDQVRLAPAVGRSDQPVDGGPTFRTEKQAAGTNLSRSVPIRPLSEPVVADSVFGQEALGRLQPVAIHALRVPDYTITRQVIQLPQQPTEPVTESPRAPLQWLASVSPLSTFQLMTILARPETYVQQVDAPAAFSAPTWGYQVSGGLVWRQFTVQLMAGQLRRWAYYELATNEYRIEPTGLNEYRITRLGRSIMENNSLTMLGASLGKEYTLGLGKRPGQYAARLGGQGTYLPATGQTILWGQASLTVGIPLKNAYAVQLGPTVQYGFSRLFSGDRQLVIHPFLVGASLTIRPAAH